jgi:hypothetical protein
VAARSVSLTATSDIITYDGDGVVVSPQGAITLTATPFNITGSAYYQFLKYNEGAGNYQPLTTPEQALQNTYQLSNDAPQPGETAVFKVTLRDGGGIGQTLDENATVFAENEVTIVGVQSGGNPYNVSLTNENSSIFVDVYGATTFTGTGTNIIATKGSASLSAVNTFSASVIDYAGDGNTIIPNGQYRTTIYSISSHITASQTPTPLVSGSVLPNPNGIDWWFNLQKESTDSWLKTAHPRFRDEQWLCHKKGMKAFNIYSPNDSLNPSSITLRSKEYRK